MDPTQIATVSKETIAVIVAGIVTVLGAIVAGVVSIITTLRTRTVVEERSTSQDKKLDRIEILVDGRYGEVLQQLADMKRLFAQETGRRADAEQADSAQKQADEQQTRVMEAKGADVTK